MRQFTVPKANGGERVLSALYLRDKFPQRAVAQVLEPVGEQRFHPDSYAYRPRRNVAMALQRCGERIRCGFPWLEKFASTRSLFGGARGIPQGALISPFLCNLHLDAIDREWARQRIPFVLYADDFLLFTPTEAEAQRALQFTERQLGRLGLALHPGKSRVVRASRDVAFLGSQLPAPPAPKG